MSSAKRPYRKKSHRRIYVRGERHDPPDTYLLARALLDLAAEVAAAKSVSDPDRSPINPSDTSQQRRSQP
ncbi:hypothetical protein [Nocardia amikacinitolerans]|uniref:hypothetical protein n=1 Tax=Nocardia amikacinitolerans TaxID=756689 RepID=UPI0020A400B2|nr:hypothetical protein [Nocardia amikacinitolerans]MCP2290947.1 hypothetical protein [Nocardia amikacinitolerans]